MLDTYIKELITLPTIEDMVLKLYNLNEDKIKEIIIYLYNNNMPGTGYDIATHFSIRGNTSVYVNHIYNVVPFEYMFEIKSEEDYKDYLIKKNMVLFYNDQTGHELIINNSQIRDQIINNYNKEGLPYEINFNKDKQIINDNEDLLDLNNIYYTKPYETLNYSWVYTNTHKDNDINNTSVRVPYGVTGYGDISYGDRIIEELIIPDTVKNISFSCCNLKILSITIPTSVTKINFDCETLTMEPGLIPNNVTHIKFGDDFNDNIKPGVLPHSLVHLSMGLSYNMPFNDNTLPENLKYLFLSGDYNQPFTVNTLPKSLKELRIRDSLYESEIEVKSSYNYELLPGVLPDNLKILVLDSYYYEFKPGVLPKSLEELELPKDYPYSLKKILTPALMDYFFRIKYPNTTTHPYNMLRIMSGMKKMTYAT
jgi:hypothetical protein